MERTAASINKTLQSQGNPWRFDLAAGIIVIDKPVEYYIVLDRCRTSAEVLDWISQVMQKTWATDAILAGLVRALDEVLQLQPNLCSGGVERGHYNWRVLF